MKNFRYLLIIKINKISIKNNITNKTINISIRNKQNNTTINKEDLSYKINIDKAAVKCQHLRTDLRIKSLKLINRSWKYKKLWIVN